MIRIMVGGEIKLGLWTDGQKFKLWTNKLDIAQKSINQFLLDLDQDCHLPPEPQDAFALLKITWESKDLSAAQFAQLHRGFTEALSKYAANMQGRYADMIATRTSIVSLDADAYSTIYDNSHEHVQIDATNQNSDPDPSCIARSDFRSWPKRAFIDQFGGEYPNSASVRCNDLVSTLAVPHRLGCVSKVDPALSPA